MTDGKKSIILYFDYRDHLALLSDGERGELIMALLDFAEDGVLPDFTGAQLMAFSFIKRQIERDEKKYKAKCDKNKENIAKRWKEHDTNVYDRIRTDTNAYQPIPSDTKHTDTDKDKETDKDKDTDKDTDTDKDIYKGVQGEKKTKTPKKEAVDPFKTFTDNPQILTALKDFEEMRKKIKKPLTDRAKQMLLTELTKLSTNEDTQLAILNQSILHNWQTVYALKGNDQQQPQQPQKKSFQQIVAERTGKA